MKDCAHWGERKKEKRASCRRDTSVIIALRELRRKDWELTVRKGQKHNVWGLALPTICRAEPNVFRKLSLPGVKRYSVNRVVRASHFGDAKSIKCSYLAQTPPSYPQPGMWKWVPAQDIRKYFLRGMQKILGLVSLGGIFLHVSLATLKLVCELSLTYRRITESEREELFVYRHLTLLGYSSVSVLLPVYFSSIFQNSMSKIHAH